MLKTYSRAWVEIDYEAIKHNVKAIQKRVGKTKIMGIVKANAYGHGDVACAKKLVECGIDFLAVSSLDEAIKLRNNDIKVDILILGYTPKILFSKLNEYHLIQTLISLEYALMLNDYAKEHNEIIRAHVKVDTGMGRIGIVYNNHNKNYDDIKKEYALSNIKVEGIFSHFPVSDELDIDSVDFTKNQIKLYNEVLEKLKDDGIEPGLTHLQNSYGIINYGDLGYDYCRPGLLYMGVTSNDEIATNYDMDLRPILSMYTNVSLVKTIQKGDSISYGRHFIAPKEMRVATIAIGYADGLPRLISNRGLEVLIHEKRVPIIGNICMDQCMIDVSAVPDVKIGDEVCVIGRQGSETVKIDTISRLAKTINNETLSKITSRVDRLEKRK